MKKTLPVLLLLLLMASFSYGQTVIAYSSFEEQEAVGGQYSDTGDAATDHPLPNHDGEPIMNYAPTPDNAELGFSSFYYNTLNDGGLTDGDYVGVTNYAGSVGSYTDGTQGFQMSDADGMMELAFEMVSLENWTEAQLTLDVFVVSDGWETADFIKVWLETDATTDSVFLLNTQGSDIDDLTLEGQWNNLSADLAGYGQVTLKIALQSNASNEAIYIDNIKFTGNPAAAEEALYSITFAASDGQTGNYTLYAGIDPTATEGLDQDLEEAELPPAPPSGVFDARFIFPDNVIGSLRDYRFGEEGFSGSYEHKLQWQLGENSTGLNLVVTVPEVEGDVQVNIQDYFGGSIVNETLGEGIHTVNVTNTQLTSVKVTVTYTDVIPVELTAFSASVVNGKTILKWQTATETNNKGFDIERSSDNKNFASIGFVDGKGTTAEAQNYTFTDNELVNGTVYYRLKQVDYDGSYEYTKSVEVSFTPEKYNIAQNYPNPFNPSTVISYAVPVDAKVVIKVYNTIGQEIAELVNGNLAAGSYNVTLDGSQLTSGIYFYVINAAGSDGSEFNQVRKMILMK